MTLYWGQSDGSQHAQDSSPVATVPKRGISYPLLVFEGTAHDPKTQFKKKQITIVSLFPLAEMYPWIKFSLQPIIDYHNLIVPI